MSFPRYGRYRDSGVEWLGEVPSHWTTPHVKRVARLTYGDALAVDVRDPDGEVAVYGSNGPVGVHSTANTSAPVVLVGRKGSCGALNWSSTPVFGIDTVFFVDGQSTSASLRWLYWSLHALRLDALSQDTGVPGLPRELAYELRLPTPPEHEQVAIAEFLDRETARIDALVEEQRRLINLLKEKRQAVVSHAVTKGLDPAAPMKDSGVEWLGEVPAHWIVAPLKRYSTLLSGFAFPSAGFTDDPSHIPLLRGINVGVGRTRWEEVVYWERAEGDDLDDYLLRAGDLVLGMDRPWISDGLRIAVISNTDLPCLLLQRVAAIRPDARLCAAYVPLLLEGEAFHHHCVPEMTGVSVPHISPGQVGDFVVAIPPLPEQEAISAFVNSVTRQTGDLIEAASATVALLQERRAALITAAVTGKIDVRGLARTEQPTAEAA